MWSDQARQAAAEARKGLHSAQIDKLPVRGTTIMSDATWRATMPAENYSSQISDLLGMWGGGGHTPSRLSPSESARINDAYSKREDWRAVARSLNEDRQSVVNSVAKKYGR